MLCVLINSKNGLSLITCFLVYISAVYYTPYSLFPSPCYFFKTTKTSLLALCLILLIVFLIPARGNPLLQCYGIVITSAHHVCYYGYSYSLCLLLLIMIFTIVFVITKIHHFVC